METVAIITARAMLPVIIHDNKKTTYDSQDTPYNRVEYNYALFMVALWNRETIYIFILFLLLLLFFARLISAVGDWMSTILRHMVWS